MEIQSDLDAREAMEHIKVAVLTPMGPWPTEGYFEVPLDQKVSLQLVHAAASLHIEDTADWVAVASGKELDPSQSYRANGLSDIAIISYGKRKAAEERT
jgi:hypothetical protein